MVWWVQLSRGVKQFIIYGSLFVIGGKGFSNQMRKLRLKIFENDLNKLKIFENLRLLFENLQKIGAFER